MSFFHRNFATHGLFPGITSHRSVANLGQYEIEIIVKPVTPTVGGGGGGWLHPIKDREITIRITKNGETWETTQVTSKYFADGLIKVFAKLVGFRTLTSNIVVRIKNFGINIKEIFVTSKKL